MKTIKVRFDHFWQGFDYRLYTRYFPPQYHLELSDSPDYLIFSVYGSLKRKSTRQCRLDRWRSVLRGDYQTPWELYYETPIVSTDAVRIFISGEPVTPDMDRCDYAFCFDFEERVKSDRYVRQPGYARRLWSNGISGRALIKPADFDPDRVLAEKTRFCNFVYSNHQPEFRVRFFDLLSKYKRVDAAGSVRHNMGNGVRLGPTMQDKLDFLRPYKFTIAFENQSWPGYTTEKLVDPMLVHSLPIYWGNPQVDRDFNPRSFVNFHDTFRRLPDLVDLIVALDEDDRLYKSYLRQPYLHGNVLSPYLDLERSHRQFERIFG